MVESAEAAITLPHSVTFSPKNRYSASGIVFITLEDETGQANLVVWSSVFEQYRSIIMSSDLLACSGTVQQADNVTHVVATRFYDLSEWLKRVGEEETEIEARTRDLMGGTGGGGSKIVVRSRDFH